MTSPAIMGDDPEVVEKVAQIVFAVFLVTFLLDVGGAFGLKQFGSVVVLGYVLVNVARLRVPIEVLLVDGTLFVLLPGLLLLIALGGYRIPPGDAFGELSYLGTWVIFPLLLMMPPHRMVAVFSSALVFGAALTVILFVGIGLMYLAGGTELVAAFNEFTFRNRLGYFGQRPVQGTLLGFVPNVYFRWTMLLIPGVTLLAGRDSKRLVLILVAIALTVSAGVILFSAVGLVLLAILCLGGDCGRVRRGTLLGLSALALVGVTVWLSPYRELIGLMVENVRSEAGAGGLRLGHMTSIVDMLRTNVLRFLFGMGVGSVFFTQGTGEFVSNVEVSHFNLVRQYGAVFSVLMFAYLIHVSVRLYRSDSVGRRLLAGLWALFLAAGTNPLLLSPVFFTMLILCRAYGFTTGSTMPTVR